MLNKKTIIKLISALPIALIAISPNIAYADNSGGEQSSSETSQSKESVSYQSAYWRCINKENGQVLQTMYADTVKVVDGVPERKMFNLGQVPKQIGDYQLAGQVTTKLEVDPSNPSGMTYIDCDYLPAHHSEADEHHIQPDKQQNIVNDAKKAYRNYHHTDKGFVVPGYYDQHNQYHPTMSLDEWRQKNKMPGTVTPGPNSKTQIAAAKNKAKKQEKNKVPGSKEKAKKAAMAKNKAEVKAQNRNANILKFVVIPLIALAIISIFIPWQKIKGKHSHK